jgi:hypothetical protein
MRSVKRPAVSALLLGSAVVVSVAIPMSCERASSTDPDPPSGGRSFVLDYDAFATVVDPILTANGCDNVTCHGGGIRGTFELSPAANKDVDMDFDQACMQVNGNDPAASPLLRKPLDEAAGGSAHAGGSAFASTDDPDYQAILAWIEAGEYR